MGTQLTEVKLRCTAGFHQSEQSKVHTGQAVCSRQDVTLLGQEYAHVKLDIDINLAIKDVTQPRDGTSCKLGSVAATAAAFAIKNEGDSMRHPLSAAECYRREWWQTRGGNDGAAWQSNLLQPLMVLRIYPVNVRCMVGQPVIGWWLFEDYVRYTQARCGGAPVCDECHT
jgi:hypothetical protein